MNTLLSLTHDLNDLLVPIFVCVVLPCVIVWLNTRQRRREIEAKTEIAMKAIEHGVPLNDDLFSSHGKAFTPKSIKEKVFAYLKNGCILTGLGIAFFAVAIICRQILREGVVGFIIPGSIMLLLGIAFIVTYFIARRRFAAEIAAEERKYTEEK